MSCNNVPTSVFMYFYNWRSGLMVIANGANGELPAGNDCMNIAQILKSSTLHCIAFWSLLLDVCRRRYPLRFNYGLSRASPLANPRPLSAVIRHAGTPQRWPGGFSRRWIPPVFVAPDPSSLDNQRGP